MNKILVKLNQNLIVFGSLFVGGVGILSQILLIYFLGNSNYSSIILSSQSLLETLIIFVPAVVLYGNDSFFQYCLNKFKNERDLLDYLKIYLVRSFSILCIVLIVVFVFFGIESDLNRIELMAILTAAFAIFYTYVCSFVYRFRLKLFISSCVERVLLLILMLFYCLAYFTGRDGYTSYLYCVIAASLITALISLALINREISLKFSIIIKSIVSFDLRKSSFYFICSSIIIFLFDRLDQLILLNLFGVAALSAYFICFKISYFSRMISSMLSNILYPLMAKQMAVSDADNSTYSKLMKLTVISSILIALPIFLFTEQFILFFDNNADVVEKEIVWILLISMFISSVNQVQSNKLSSIGYSNTIFTVSVIGFLLQLSFIYFSYQDIHLYSIAFARLIASIFGFLYFYTTLRLKSC